MNTKSITSVTFILVGNSLSIYGSIASGWGSSLVAIFGLVLFFIGLSRLKTALDEKGKIGVGLLIWSAILGIIASVFGLIPLVGIIPAALFNLAAFILELIGLLKLKSSTTLGSVGASGVTLLLVAMIILIVAGIFNLIPLIGGTIKEIFALAALIIIPFGWIKIQESLIEYKA